MYRGLAYVILGDQAVADFPSQFTDWGFGTFAGTQIPNPFVLFIVLAVVFGVVLHFTGIGRSIFAMGANEEAAHFSGVRVKRIKFWLFVVTGTISALAGIVYTFRFASARADNGVGLELSVVAVVLLGGVSIFGGRGQSARRHLRRAAARHAAQRADAQRRLRRSADHRHGQPAAALRPRPERHRSGPRGAAPGTRRRRTPNPHHHLTPCEEGNVHSEQGVSRRSR